MPRLRTLSTVLIFATFLDELSCGVPFVGAPGVQGTFGVSYGMAAGWTLAAVHLLSFILEPPLFVLSDRYPRRWFICGGLFALGLICIGSGLAPTYWLLLVGLALFGPASGAGVSLSQAALMDANPGARERWMLRWTLSGVAGDLATPVLFAALALFALGWRTAFVTCGFLLLAYAALLWTRDFPERSTPGPGEKVIPIRTAVAAALGNRRLLRWLFGVWLCGLLDETLVAFGTLHMRDHLGAGTTERSALLVLWTIGSAIGLVATERLLERFRPLPLLAACSVLGVVVYVAWVFAASVAVSGVLFFGVGLLTAPLYPLAKAQAYRALPDQAGMVNAVAHVFKPLDILLPLALGLIADRFGLAAALVVLAAQPAGLFWIAIRSRDP
jgi:FSR family fosmidomycin resistance protein-like MFS transporter